MAHIQTQYGGLWKPQDLALDKISSQKMFIDNIDFIESFIKEGKQKLHQSVKTIADLKAIDTSDTTLFTTGMLIMVYEIGIFYFNRNATGTDSSDIITPTTGGGRWILIASSGGSDPITPESIGAIPSSDKGKAGGVATLDSSGKVPSGQIPSLECAFYAIYGTTTNAEILAAYEAGKAVYVKDVPSISSVVLPLVSVNTLTAQFSSINPNGVQRSVSCSNDGWVTYDSKQIAKKPVSTAVTLSASGWNSSSKTQTVTVSGVLADETKQLITPTPAIASQTAYYNAGIRCTGQSEGKLTFTANNIPTENLTVYVVIQEVYKG